MSMRDPKSRHSISCQYPPGVQWWWVNWVKHRCIRQPCRSHDRFSTPTGWIPDKQSEAWTHPNVQQWCSQTDQQYLRLPAEIHSRSHQHAKDKPEVTRCSPDELEPSNDQGAEQMKEDIHLSVEGEALNKHLWSSDKHGHFAYALTLMHFKTNEQLALWWHVRTEFHTPSKP